MRSIYYDDNWAVLQQEKEGGIAETYLYSESECKVKYVFIKRKAGVIDGVQYFDILTPRGMGGPRCTNKQMVNLERYDKDFTSYCKEKHIIAEYVRFDPWNCNHKIFGALYDELEHHGNLFCNHLNSDFYKNEYSKSVQRNIKKNISDIEIEFDYKGETIDKFLELYQYTEKKYLFNEYYRLSEKFLTKYFSSLKGKVAIVNAKFINKVISSSVILFGEDIVHYHFTGNDPMYKKKNANSVLMYQTAIIAQEMGKEIFDLGGGIIDSNIADFKSLFVNECGIYPYYVGKRILDRKIYNKLVEIKGKSKPGYFPEYIRES